VLTNRAAKTIATLLATVASWSGRTASAADVGVAHSGCEDVDARWPPSLEGYEPTRFGYTKQGDDVPFIDFTVSIKVQLLRSPFCHWFPRDTVRLYLTFTGRFGFYLGTRPSSPVIAKNYNPKLLWRWIPDPESTLSAETGGRRREYKSYFDFAYAHDSNGQSISTAEQYDGLVRQVSNPNYALDYISRGWDYLDFATKQAFSGETARVNIYPELKYFLRHGLLQGVPEEYHSWEGGSPGQPRHAYDGILMEVDYLPYAGRSSNSPRWDDTLRLALKYMTGYEPIARYNTVRGEIGLTVLGLPLNLWAQDGYMNSLARYYFKTTSVGLEVRLTQW